jgi:hypothetical protein
MGGLEGIFKGEMDVEITKLLDEIAMTKIGFTRRVINPDRLFTVQPGIWSAGTEAVRMKPKIEQIRRDIVRLARISFRTRLFFSILNSVFLPNADN